MGQAQACRQGRTPLPQHRGGEPGLRPGRRPHPGAICPTPRKLEEAPALPVVRLLLRLLFQAPWAAADSPPPLLCPKARWTEVAQPPGGLLPGEQTRGSRLLPGRRLGDGTRAAREASLGFPGPTVLPAVAVHPRPVSSHAGRRGARRAVGAETKSYGLAHQGWQCPCPCCWSRPTEPSPQHQLRARRCRTGKQGRQDTVWDRGREADGSLAKAPPPGCPSGSMPPPPGCPPGSMLQGPSS